MPASEVRTVRRFRIRRDKKLLRYAAVVLGLLLLVGTLGGIKFLQISRLIAYGEQMQAMGPPPETVSTAIARADSWERTLNAVGTVTSTDSVEIRNEVPGVVTKIAFNSGDTVNANAVLVELDAVVERNQLESSRAQLAQAMTDLRRTRKLVQGGAVARAQLDSAEAAVRTLRAQVEGLEGALAKKTLRAPHAGRVGIRKVSSGEFLNVGTLITSLDAEGEVFVDFDLPQEDASLLQPGLPARVSFSASPKVELSARIVAVSPTVDRVTRNLEVRADVDDPAEQLRPGMFVDVAVVMPERLEVVSVPATAVVHAPYGDSVFVIEEKPADEPGMHKTPDGRPVRIARQRFVRVGTARGDFLEIVKGLSAGAQVVTAGAFKLRNGSPVVVDNSTAPEPKLDPSPENR